MHTHAHTHGHAYACRDPPSQPVVRMSSSKLASRRVLHVNTTTALQSTVEELQHAFFSRAGGGRGAAGEGGGGAVQILDFASGDSGACVSDVGEASRVTIRLVEAPAAREARVQGTAGQPRAAPAAREAREAPTRGQRHHRRRTEEGAAAATARRRWTPSLHISLSEARQTAHRVWPCAAQICPHAVVISEVTYVHARMRARPPACMHTCVRACTYACLHTSSSPR